MNLYNCYLVIFMDIGFTTEFIWMGKRYFKVSFMDMSRENLSKNLIKALRKLTLTTKTQNI